MLSDPSFATQVPHQPPAPPPIPYSAPATPPLIPATPQQTMSTTTKKATKPASKKAAAAARPAATHPTWVDMIKLSGQRAIIVANLVVCPLKHPTRTQRRCSLSFFILECIAAHTEDARHGVSRPQIKKFVETKYKLDFGAAQTTQLARAITSGADKKIFVLPKGPSGRVKLAPKSKPAADSSAKENKPATKPASKGKAAATTKPKAAKSTTTKAKPTKAATTKAVAAKPKAAAPKPKPAAAAPKTTKKPTIKAGTKKSTTAAKPASKPTSAKKTTTATKRAPAKKAATGTTATTKAKAAAKKSAVKKPATKKEAAKPAAKAAPKPRKQPRLDDGERIRTTIERLLEAVVQHNEEFDHRYSDEPMDTATELVLITAENLSTIHRGLSSPVEPFASLFIGMSVDEVTSWFIENIQEPEMGGYMGRVFIILDEDAVTDEVCTVVSALDESGGMVHCEFEMALGVVCWAKDTALDEETLGAFSRSGMILTEENVNLLGGCVDKDSMANNFWRDFYEKYGLNKLKNLRSYQTRYAIFCTTEVPISTVESFLEITEEYQMGLPELFEDDPMDTTDWLALVTSRDLSAIHHGLSSPVQPFTSPFVGMSVDELTEWFEANTAQPEPLGCNRDVFIILNDESITDGVCTVVSILDEPAGSLRCEFKLAMGTLCLIEHQGSMEECVGPFMRTGEVMTEENQD
ncbi:hypothetical protein D9619_006020 [Psilocybe cf. subviscida]|uniref:Histone H1 n=1 Tax=Psilocybe cf. subviscida TaxID=2480587 RepID=A0A8H5FB92_9AGAR|nr:hypothetical protein D9619_006020 [Psilocybe cf. subviscida]